MTEDEVGELLEQELEGEKRWSIVQRLHQRYTILRAARERDELKQEIAFRIKESGFNFIHF